MWEKTLLVAILAVFTNSLADAGPYAPAAGQPGSTAVAMDDPALVAWATDWRNYLVGEGCDTRWQSPELALGQATGTSEDIVGLGRGGQITMTFTPAITDRPGWDFAVFENGLSDGFLELGYVEVSSNGADFFRFTNDSLTADPVGAFGTLDATNIDGLAGKYRQGFGTPFDLERLDGVSPLLDVENIGYVKIVDVVGDGTMQDSSGDVIHDPYPTAGSAGFDLDAIGVIHQVPEPGALVLLLPAAVCFGFLRFFFYSRR